MSGHCFWCCAALEIFLSLIKQKNMKTILSLFVLFFAFTLVGKSQVVYSCSYKSDAQVKVYVADYKSDADLVVYKCSYKSDATGNDGLWYFAEYKSDADKTIYFCDYKSDADLVIYFADYKSDAGWQNSSKKHLMY
jgi:hypothetical protein